MPLIAVVDTQMALVIAAAVITVITFTALILVPAVGAFGRFWEKATVAVLSLFVLAVLIGIGLAIGVVIVYYWDEIGTWFG